MPKFSEILGYSVFVWSNEGKPIEPVHVHVSKNISKNSTKFWILSDGSVKLAFDSKELSAKDLAKVQRVLQQYSKDYVEKWKEFFDAQASFIDE